MFNPGFQLPGRVGTDVAEQNLQAPPILRTEIKASDKWFQANGRTASDVAERIVAARAGQIHQFWQAQQQNYNAGVVKIVSRALSLPQLTIRYDAIQGTQILTLTVYPESSPPKVGEAVIDINLDGYIAFFHHELFYPHNRNPDGSLYVSGPYDLFINGYLVLTDMKIENLDSCWIVMIGDTALQLPSIHDKENPLKLLAGSVPDRGNVKEVQGTQFGVMIPAHKDLPGYFVFDWGDGLNPDNYAMDNNAGPWAHHSTGPTRIVRGIHFADPTKCPLNPTGDNLITIQPSDGGKPGPFAYDANDDYVLAEFFDRQSMRVVQSTHKYPQAPGRTVTTNDKPLYWEQDMRRVMLKNSTSASTGGGSGTLEVDLTPAKTYPLAAALGEPPIPGSAYYTPPTSNMNTLWQAYSDKNAQYIKDTTAYSKILSAAVQAYEQANLNYIKASWPSGSLITSFFFYIHNAAPAGPDAQAALDATTAEGVAATAFQSAQTYTPDYTTKASAWVAAATVAMTAAKTAFQSLAALTPSSGPVQAALAVNINLANVRLSTLTAYMAAAGDGGPQPPTVPAFSSAGGVGIANFRYRTFTVAADNTFTFDQWNF